jgi:hypothetical protein
MSKYEEYEGCAAALDSSDKCHVASHAAVCSSCLEELSENVEVVENV